jgi:chitin disaccharide deacetylase
MVGARKRILIVNADDLGYTRGINQAIRQCSTAGVLCSSTLMANGAAFDDAVAMVRDHENLDVGVHLVLTELPPVSPLTRIRGLVDERGCLPASPWKLMAGLLEGRISRAAVRQELSSQVAKVVDSGLRPTHLDSHKHVHVMPQVLDVVIEIARKFCIPWIRNPFDETRFFRLLQLVDGRKTRSYSIQHLKAKAVGACRPSFWGRIRGSGMRLPDHFFGISLTGLWNEAAVYALLNELPPGITEWMVHPGKCDQDLLRLDCRLSEQRERERDLLMSPELVEHLARQRITLSSYRVDVA